jgi:hypothetical protein
MTAVPVKKTGNNVVGKGKPGPGRPKGVPNRSTGAIKEMVIAALEQAGGIDYLAARAKDTPAAFMTLVGKVLPLQLTGDPAQPIATTSVTLEEVMAAMANIDDRC